MLDRVLAFALVVVLAVELALWEGFFVVTRPFGLGIPVAALVAVVGNVALGRAGARVLGGPLGAVVPGVLWLAIAFTLSTRTSAGSVVVTNSFRGLAFLVAGTAAAASMVGLSGAARVARTTPLDETRR